jgi:multisubunit Na+/H+ antiporter MnhB subunit
MTIRRKISIFIGLTQGVLGALSTTFAYVLYYNLFDIQTLLSVPQSDVLLYMLVLIVFGLLSITSGLFLTNEQ